MGNASRIHHAGLVAAFVLIAGAPALAQLGPIRVDGMTAEQVIANLVTRCGQDSGAVEQATATMVVCVRQGNFGDMLLFGTRNGAMPVYRHRYVIVPVGNAVSVFASATIDTMNAFGGANSRPLNMRPDDLAKVMAAVRGDFPDAPFKAADPPEPDWKGPNNSPTPEPPHLP